MLKNLLLGKLPHYTRKVRHVRQLLKHSTPKKVFNLVAAEWALRQGKTTLRSLPYIYIIDPCNACNLRCPLCPTGNQTLGRPTKMMHLDCYRSIIDQVKDYAIEVILHNWGESFLHPGIFDMLRYARDADIGTTVSSHFNNITDRMIEQMIDIGPEHLTVSIDGATQSVYETYRVRGDLENALSGLRRLQRRKKERRSDRPIVEWQFIVMKHNEHEIPTARELAEALGVERFRLLSVGLPFNRLDDTTLARQWMSETPAYRGYAPDLMRTRGYLYDEPCFYPYRAITINPDGGVAPCCAIDHQKWDFGNVTTEPITGIWNNRSYQSARSLFSDHPIAEPVKTVCDGCPLYKQRKHRLQEAKAS